MTGRVVSVQFFVPGRPVPKGRPRGRVVVPKGGGKPFVNVYTDEATKKWEDWVQHIVTQQLVPMDITIPFLDRVSVSLRFNLEKPQSSKLEYPVKSRTDIDNLVKSVLDGLQNALVLSNDCIVTDLYACKRYADSAHPEGVEIDITAL